MYEYIIRCTDEQTRKAFDLGAPIEILPNYTEFRGLSFVKCQDGNERPCVPPTAEQMIGWIEEQYGIYDIRLLRTADGEWKYEITIKHIPKNKVYGCCKSRPEATLAAIDAALDYLSQRKEE